MFTLVMAFVYNCCFWFSLRLGGIIIGIFSLMQGLIVLAAFCVAHTRVPEVQEEIGHLINSMNLMFTKDYLENVRADPEKSITLGICLSCLYMLLCVLYIYGAYTCNNLLMFGYILVELMRLVALSVLVASWLLVLKQNTMDIGLLIGASVGCGFFLLGMFYLWVCAANLPVLINEMERDEQAATIERLRRILQENPKATGRGSDGYRREDSYRDVFIVQRKGIDPGRQFHAGSRVSVPYYR
ncbi:uncharacterized protein LOC126367246 [Pectinophora gossypiella]|uniref:uncharacterized protein LOC126367246 n=1 Tax=Pectinophora gossypiella TaxID=13191 RepID=UPI00214F41AA|nr:uncharacterized protein LOC126367246 [Pectinophora gossypiella]